MKKSIFTLFVILFIPFNGSLYAQDKNVIDMYLMRKGSKVYITLMSAANTLPSKMQIDRKTNAPLSEYRKIKTVSSEDISILKEKGKLLLADNYPESIQLDSYYRIRYSSGDTMCNQKSVFLSRSVSGESVIFGDHKKDALLFEDEEEVKNLPSYEKENILFKVKRDGVKVLVTLSMKRSNLDGTISIERKTSKPLSEFRKIKSISGEDKSAVKKGERVFLDKYIESRQLDSYYRLIITKKDGKRLDFPAIFLLGNKAK